ncbi:Alpha-D-glucose-1-phosphate phosphatase YihX [Bremerella volcania]|uniref:Alpha-D-glucose-1-phosphate phosphatase YihX n=1 Tax=Bremerella volcania TaxID=2527984 RepID=A0A518C5J4_9BACT|nr:HAD family phosphatase [Bremerella volcania]QDU74495.1 Alpha-D-glucose-1-phosphate phosphatase YihX [Bremerella volcania]
MSSPLEFFYFDLGKVLLDFDHEIACRQMADVLGTTAETIRTDVFHSGEQWKYERGEITTLQLHRWLCDRYDVEAKLEDVCHAASHIFHPIPGTIEIAAGLHAAGHQLGILSNTCDAHWEYCLGRPFPFLNDFFPIHALSFRLGTMKPDPEIYRKAAALCGVSPEKIFFVDDREENVAGAAGAGYDAVLFTGAADLSEALTARGVRF